MPHQLYEVAVLTPFTTRDYQKNATQRVASDPHKLDSAVPSLQTPSLVHFQNNSFVNLSKPPPNWNKESRQDLNTHLWAMGSCNLGSGMPGNVENAQSQSSYSSQGSISSWGTESSSWSRGSLVSSESLNELAWPGNMTPSVNFRQTGFTDISFDANSNTQSQIESINQQSASAIGSKQVTEPTGYSATGSKQVTEPTGFSATGSKQVTEPVGYFSYLSALEHEVASDVCLEQMIERVVEDLSELEASTSQDKPWNPLTSRSRDYSKSRFTGKSVFHNVGFPEVLNVCEKKFQVSNIDKKESILDGNSAVEHVRSVLISGQVSRSSSLSSLFTTTSSASDDNLADQESCESLADHRSRKLSSKWKPTNSSRNVFAERRQTSLQKYQESSQVGRAICRDLTNLMTLSEQSNSTSGFSEISAHQSVSSDSDTSSLNPNSRPFIPRTHLQPNFQADVANFKVGQNTEPSLSQSNILCQSYLPCNHLSDSGRASNSLNTNTETDFSVEASKMDYFPNETSSDLFLDANGQFARKGVWEDISVTSENTSEDFPPYDCKLRHGAEFVSIQEFSITKLPAEYQTWSTMETIVAISQRVVKLRTRKPLRRMSPTKHRDLNQKRQTDDSADGPLFDHYGTGFVCHAESDWLVVRTHSEVVCSSIEAANTEVMFQITPSSFGKSEWVHCMGQVDGFATSIHSMTTKFLCRTPPQLLPYLHLFHNVPAVRRSSLFSDSCYFSDSSLDNSASDHEQSVLGAKICLPEEQVHENVSEKDNVRNPEITSSMLREQGGKHNPRMNDFQEHVMHLKQELSSVCNDTTVKIGYPEHNIPINQEVSYCSNASSDKNISFNKGTHLVQSNIGNVISAESGLPAKFQSRIGDKPTHPTTREPFQNSNTNHVVTENTLLNKDCNSSNSSTGKCQWSLDDERSCPSFDVFRLNQMPRKSLMTLFEDALLPRPSNLPWLRNHETNVKDRGVVPEIQGVRKCASIASPLVIMETKFESSRGDTGGNKCPYDGQNIFQGRGQYQCFSSFAGDVLDSFVVDELFRKTPQGATSSQTNVQWEYESLIFAQSHHRLAYNSANRKPHPQDVAANLNGNQTQKEELSVSRKYDPLEKQNIPTNESIVFSSAANRSESEFRQTEVHNADSYPDTTLSNQRSTHPTGIDANFRESNNNDEFQPLLTSEAVVTSSSQGKDDQPCLSLGSQSYSLTCDCLSDFSSRDAYIDTWDTDLLNLDKDLNPLPQFDQMKTPVDIRSHKHDMNGLLQFGHIEAMIDRLLEDDDRDYVRGFPPVCCPETSFTIGNHNSDSTSERTTPRCVLISYPHGGPKMVSTGLFSRHSLVGGVLYDTPTCMGSCGAPVIALTQNVEKPFVTQFIHAGSIKVNGVSVGAAESYFDTPLPNFP